MAKNFLSNAERLELIEKYKAEKLNDPPVNISDKTLITNFGTDAQKARLVEPQAGAQETPKVTTETQNGENNTETQGDQGNNDLDDLMGTSGEGENSNPSQEPKKDAKYVAAFNEYLALNEGQAPTTDLTTEQIEALNKSKKDAAEAAKKAAKKAAGAVVASKPVSNASGEMVDLVNKNTKEKIRVTRFAYENFIKKSQPEFQLMPTPPKEVIGK